MYRKYLPVLLYLTGVASAPQDTPSSEITYVKIQPIDRLADAPHPRSPYRESRIEILPLTIPGRVQEVDSHNRKIDTEILQENSEEIGRHIRSEEVTTSETETTYVTETTERDERVEELIQLTDEYESRTKAPSPRFLTKLSYFGDEKSTSIITNLVGGPARKRFKSKCRCEKIWNCPKLQITVPRCPNEYFLCCF